MDSVTPNVPPDNTPAASNILPVLPASNERKKALLRFFGSFEQITKASTKDLMEVRGVGKKTADIIFRNLH